VRTIADPTKAWEVKTFKHDKILTTCRFTLAGDAILAGSFDGKIHRWVVETGEHTTLAQHVTWISAMIPTSDRVYSADFQGNLKAWDLAASKEAWKVDGAHPGWLKTLALSPDGALLASGARDGIVRLWSAADGKLVKELKGHARDVYSAAFHPDGKSLATGDYDGKILHWDVATGKVVRTLDAGILTTRSPEFLCDVGGVRALAFDATGKRLAASGLRDAKSNTFCPGVPAGIVFDWESGKATNNLKGKDDKMDGGILSLRFMADGTLVGCAEAQNYGAIWYWKPGEAEPFHATGGLPVYDIDIQPDGMAVAGSFYQTIGKGGNGRGDKRGEYVPNGGTVRMFGLYEKPKPAPKAPPAKPAPKK
jgi:WD40 repeat protein